MTLKFGLELARQLKAGGKLEPVLTRDGDDFLSLAERVDVRAASTTRRSSSRSTPTACAEDYVRGATVYTLSDDASDALAAALAERENRSDILAGLALEDQPDDVADILFDLARRETQNLSIRFAKTLVDDMRRRRRAERQSVAAGLLPRAEGAGRALGPARARLSLQRGGREAVPVATTGRRDEAETVARAIEAFFGGDATAGQ